MKKLSSTIKKTQKKNSAIFPVLIEQDENGMYVGSIPSIRSCYTQGRTLEELYENLKEVVQLCLETEKKFFGPTSRTNRIVGFQNIEFKVS